MARCYDVNREVRRSSIVGAASSRLTGFNVWKYLKHRPRVGLLLLLLTGQTSCELTTSSCTGPEFRSAYAETAIADAADTLHAMLYIRAIEQRGGGEPDARSLLVNVQARPLPATVPPFPSLFGHATGARLELVDGSFLLAVSLHTQDNLPPGQIGFTLEQSIDPVLFAAIRAALLANQLVVSVETDSSVPTLRRGATILTQTDDWARRICQ